jgi:hypothetical protein
MEWIKAAWRGEERLWKVYWVYGFLLSIGLKIAYFLGFMAAAMVGINFVFTPAAILFYFIYIVWLMVSEWRCAFNADWRIWGYIVRFFILLLPLGLIIGGVLVGQDLIHAAECRKAMTEAAQKEGLDLPAYKLKHPEAVEACKTKRTGTPYSAPAQAQTAPAVSVAAPISGTPAEQTCQKTMTEFAQNHNTDVAQYIASNQAYFKECVKYYNTNSTAAKP